MTQDEAKDVIRIMTTVDGKCSHCARDLVNQFLEKQPSHLLSAKHIWRDTFGTDFYSKIECEA